MCYIKTPRWLGDDPIAQRPGPVLFPPTRLPAEDLPDMARRITADRPSQQRNEAARLRKIIVAEITRLMKAGDFENAEWLLSELENQ
jgi:hypothetical protein